MSRSLVELADVIRTHGDAFLEAYGVPSPRSSTVP
jgi:hypothetical protein